MFQRRDMVAFFARHLPERAVSLKVAFVGCCNLRIADGGLTTAPERAQLRRDAEGDVHVVRRHSGCRLEMLERCSVVPTCRG